MPPRATANLTMLAVTLLLLTISACTVERISSEPPRPESVPKEALWVGGPDGGAFLTVNPSGKNRYAVQVFSESGDRLFRGTMTLDRDVEKPFAYADVNAYSAWDGQRVLLVDGRSLVR